MHKLIFVTLTLALVSLPKATLASFDTGNTLYAACTSEKSRAIYHQEQARCVGYISGVVDAHNTIVAVDGITPWVCFPQGVTAGQLQDIVVAYLQANPGERHKTASSLVMTALGDAFLCKVNS